MRYNRNCNSEQVEENIHELRGYEGLEAKLYFSLLDSFI
ncbi:MAG: CRISPR-associated endonuclease Cas1 [Anaeromicrobium sp.]|nr:CRISPR-associated endonuclease Cas1 [Anaeromicrobium sp.]